MIGRLLCKLGRHRWRPTALAFLPMEMRCIRPGCRARGWLG